MKCLNCNSMLQNDSPFCPNCGTKVTDEEPIRKIALKCANCNGILSVDSDKSVLVCPYCGATELIVENDAVKIEQIRANTQKDIEIERIKSAENQQIRAEKNLQSQIDKNDVETFKKGKFAKFLIIAFVVSVIIAFICFSQSYILAGILAVIQAGCFGVAWCMGMQIIKEVKRYIRIIIAVAGILLIIPILKSCSSDSNSNNAVKTDWGIIFLGEEIPEPSSDKMEIHTNTSDELWIEIYKTSEEDYYKYIIECKEFGYTIEANETSIGYDAYNEDGYKISISHYDDEMTIRVDTPTPMAELDWNKHAISEILPAPQSNIGSFTIENNETTTVIVGNTTPEEFKKYVNLCKENGFTVDADGGEVSYSAYNENGYKVNLFYTSGNKEMSINLDQPMAFSDIALPSVGVGALLPEPPSLLGNIGSNYDWSYSVYIGNMSKDDYTAYIQKCIESGFNKNTSDYGESFSADYANDDEIEIHISYEGNDIVHISITGSLNGEYSDYKRENTAITETPANTEATSTSAVDETAVPDETTPAENLINGMRPEFKEAMDAYEDFYTEYCNFMKKYNENPTDLTYIAEYGKMLVKVKEIDEAFEKWDNGELNDIELKYYLEVMDRINKMLIDAAL